jgi:hypothetical protein
VNITAHAISSFQVGSNATAAVQYLNDGRSQQLEQGVGTFFPTEWGTDAPISGVGAVYQIYATQTGGGLTGFTGPALNVWHTLGTTRTWQLQTAVVDDSFNITIDVSIRKFGGPTLDTAEINLIVNNIFIPPPGR